MVYSKQKEITRSLLSIQTCNLNDGMLSNLGTNREITGRLDFVYGSMSIINSPATWFSTDWGVWIFERADRLRFITGVNINQGGLSEYVRW